MLLRSLRNDTNTNILQTPSIITLDNEEAEIKVAQEVPFITGQFTNTGAAAGSVNPFQTIQREEVGTILKITPQINEGDAVMLKQLFGPRAKVYPRGAHCGNINQREVAAYLTNYFARP